MEIVFLTVYIIGFEGPALFPHRHQAVCNVRNVAADVVFYFFVRLIEVERYTVLPVLMPAIGLLGMQGKRGGYGYKKNGKQKNWGLLPASSRG